MPVTGIIDENGYRPKRSLDFRYRWINSIKIGDIENDRLGQVRLLRFEILTGLFL